MPCPVFQMPYKVLVKNSLNIKKNEFSKTFQFLSGFCNADGIFNYHIIPVLDSFEKCSRRAKTQKNTNNINESNISIFFKNDPNSPYVSFRVLYIAE